MQAQNVGLKDRQTHRRRRRRRRITAIFRALPRFESIFYEIRGAVRSAAAEEEEEELVL